MRRRSSVAAIALVVLTLPGAAHAAVTDYIGKPVASVRIVLEGREQTDPVLIELVETRIGRPLSMVEVRESLLHLFSLGRFEDVRLDATLDARGVALRYELSPVHPVTTIDFAGDVRLPGIDEGQLRRAIVDRYGSSPPLGRSEELARSIEGLLRERGYLHASARPRAEIAHNPDRATLVFTIESGARTLVGAVETPATSAEQRAELIKALHLEPGSPYQRDDLDARVARYVAERRRRGYFEASVVPAVTLADEDQVANITLSVNPGRRVRVVFAGDSIPSEKRSELVAIEREGSVDEDLLEDSSNAIEEYLRGQGYRDATAPHARDDSGSELVITFTVSKGPLYRVDRVEITGNSSIPLADFATALKLRDGQPFSGSKLDGDAATIEALYRRRGFSSVKAQTSVEASESARDGVEALVTVRIDIREGVRTVVGSVRVIGNASVPEATLRSAVGLAEGAPFIATQMAVDRDGLQLRYANLAYPSATVEANPGFSADGARADVVFTVHEGPRIFVDHVLIVGNVRTSTETIRRELQLKPGDPLGLDAVNESQRRLAALGLFRRVHITELRHGNETTRDLLVSVEEAPVTTLGYGGGFEVRLRVVQEGEAGGVASQRLEFAPRASFEIGRRNLFGKNRSVNLFTSVSLHPKDAACSADNPSACGETGYGFAEYRVLGTFREPRLFDTATDALVTGVQEQQIRASFNFARRGVTAGLVRHLSRQVSVSGSYQLNNTHVFDEKVSDEDKLLIDRLFPQVLLSSFSSGVVRDTKDDPLDPTRGVYTSVTGQIAARAIGSEVGLAKTYLTAQMFRTVRSTRVVFAGSARLGLAKGFLRDVIRKDSNGNPVIGPDGQPIVDEVDELPASERFFAGGDTTVRGFALDTLGTPETIVNGFPIGGNGVVIFNAELRAPIRGGLGVVGFFDTGNVFARASDITLTELRSAVGFGVRYKSPVGPIRIDLGFKLHREELVPGQREGLTALHISLGQAF